MLLFIKYNILGNFKEACLLRVCTDIDLEKKCNTFFNLTSSDVQNEIISIYCYIVKSALSLRLKK